MTRTALLISGNMLTAGWSNGLIITALVMLLAGYVLPWVGFDQASFTLSGFDLAEWISLHPAARAESPVLLSASLIRITLLWAGCATALLTFPAALRLVSILLIAAAVLPPPEHILSLSDPNYAQQTAIALLCVFLPSLLIFLRRWRSSILLIIGLGAVISLSLVVWRAIVLLSDFQIGMRLSIGAVSAAAAGILLCLASWMLMRRK